MQCFGSISFWYRSGYVPYEKIQNIDQMYLFWIEYVTFLFNYSVYNGTKKTNLHWCGSGSDRIRIHLGARIRIQRYKMKGFSVLKLLISDLRSLSLRFRFNLKIIFFLDFLKDVLKSIWRFYLPGSGSGYNQSGSTSLRIGISIKISMLTIDNVVFHQ